MSDVVDSAKSDSKSRSVPAGFKRTEVGVIPVEWDVVPVTAATKAIFLGLTSKVDYVSSKGIPLIRATDISGGRLSFAAARTISLRQHRALTKYRRATRGDVLVSKSGSLGVCAIVDVDTEFSIYESIIVLQPNHRLDSLFLLSLLRDEATQNRMIGDRVGSTVSHLNLEVFRTLNIPVPPFPEQRAIAEALSHVDELLGALERLIAKKRDLKQAAMQQLLTAQTRLPGFHGQWEVKRFGTLLRFQVGFPFSSAFFNEKGEGIRLVKNRDLKSDDQVFNYNGKYEETFVVYDGDVLIGMDGDFLPCRWNKGHALLNQRVGRVVPNKELNATFAYYALIEPLKEIESVTSSTTVKHLSHGDVEGIECPTPEYAEQTALAEVLSDMDAEIAALVQRREKTRALKQGMMQELLTGKTRLVDPSGTTV